MQLEDSMVDMNTFPNSSDIQVGFFSGIYPVIVDYKKKMLLYHCSPFNLSCVCFFSWSSCEKEIIANLHPQKTGLK